MNNILDFNKKYSPEVVVLKDNYRSNQLILDRSKQLIEYNSERLILSFPELTKDLQAKGAYKDDQTKPSILCFEKTSDEMAYVAQQIENIYKFSPDELSQTAVIFRWHRQVADLVEILEKREIPLNIKKRTNILDLPLVHNLINILSYLSEELNKYNSGQHRLFEILHYKNFGLNSLDLGKIALYSQHKYYDNLAKAKKEGKDIEAAKLQSVKWREVISDRVVLESLGLTDVDGIIRIAALLDKWISDVHSTTLQVAFESVINEGGILKEVMLNENKAWLLQVLSTFFDFIKKETAKNPKLNLKTFLSMLEKMKENKIEMPIHKTISSDNGVHLITAHSAKGLEYKNVFLIGSTTKVWEKSSGGFGNKYSFPDTINTDSATNIQDERRLFYVAMTRAKQELTITYAQKDEAGKEYSASEFVDQIRDDDGIKDSPMSLEPEVIAEYYYDLLQRKEKEVPLIDRDLIDKHMEGYKLSVTHLNKFLRCPLTFYFEAILKVPSARNASTGFGNAMHETVEHFMNGLEKEPEKATTERLVYLYERALNGYRSHFTDGQYDDYLTHGRMILPDLYKKKIDEWKALPKYKMEANLNNAQYKGVPIKGKLDQVEIFPTHVNVVDFKTGSHKKDKIERPSDKNLTGGDYWRQIVFYKMLLESDKKHNWPGLSVGKISYLEPDKFTYSFKDIEITVTPADMEKVGEQISDTYKKIKAYAFNKTCSDKKCQWCNFVDNNYQLTKTTESEKGSRYGA